MLNMEMFWVVGILSLMTMIEGNVNEHFVSITQMTQSLNDVRNSELEFHVTKYLQDQEKQLETIERYSDTLDGVCNRNEDDRSAESTTQCTDKTTQNNMFTIEYVNKILKEIQSFETDNFEPSILDELTEKHPITLDLRGAVTAILRIQEIYNVSHGNVVRGEMYGTKTIPLTAAEVVDIGLICYAVDKHYEAMQWFRVAMQLYHSPRDRARMVRKYAETAAEFNNPIDVTRLTAKLQLTVSSRKHRLLANREQKALAKAFQKASPQQMQRIRHIGQPRRKVPEAINYSNLCNKNVLSEPLPQPKILKQTTIKRWRGNNLPNNLVMKGRRLLTCRLQDHGHPWLRLRPLKQEELSLDPPMNLYHKAYSNYLLDSIQNASETRLKRSHISCKTGNCNTKRRISSDYYLNDHKELEEKIARVTETFANINVNTTEFAMVINYGIGGYFRIHYDFDKHSSGIDGEMDRIVSILVYMSELEDGSGATVFTNMNIAVQPERGSAVVWENLYRNGSNHMNAAHAGCPVVTGNKWLIAIMTTSYGNEFKRPCTLNKYE